MVPRRLLTLGIGDLIIPRPSSYVEQREQGCAISSTNLHHETFPNCHIVSLPGNPPVVHST
jgi:hypothetical protein